MTRDEMEEIKRHFGVVADGLRSEIRLLAEGHETLLAGQEALRSEVQVLAGGHEALRLGQDALRSDVRVLTEGQEALRSEIRLLAEGDEAIRGEIQGFRRETQNEFREVRSLIRLSYAELDERVKTIERDLVLLKSRLDQIEGRQTS